jgi:hypothetical protein
MSDPSTVQLSDIAAHLNDPEWVALHIYVLIEYMDTNVGAMSGVTKRRLAFLASLGAPVLGLALSLYNGVTPITANVLVLGATGIVNFAGSKAVHDLFDKLASGKSGSGAPTTPLPDTTNGGTI